MKIRKTCAMLLLMAALAGCRSHVIRVTVINVSSQPVTTIAIEYPGASFGINSLAPGKEFPYTIKPSETGTLKVQFTDAAGKEHRASVGQLQKNDEGAITLQLTQDSAVAETRLAARWKTFYGPSPFLICAINIFYWIPGPSVLHNHRAFFGGEQACIHTTAEIFSAAVKKKVPV